MQAFWLGAGLLWVVLSVLSVLAREGEEEGAAYVTGAIFGRLLGSLLIALLARWIYVRVRGGEREIWHPWTLVIAAGVSLIVLAVRAGS